MKGLIVIPAHNEAENLAHVIADLRAHVSASQVDLLFVDDGSKDDSVSVLKAQHVHFVRHRTNLGYEEALKTGIHYGLNHAYDFVGFFDSDGQHRACDLLLLIEAMESGEVDVVQGSRMLSQEHTMRGARFLGGKLFALVTSLITRQRFTDTTCGLKLIRRHFLGVTLSIPSQDMHGELLVALVGSGARCCEVPIYVDLRMAGKSMHSVRTAVLYPIRTFLCIITAAIGNWQANDCDGEAL